MTTIAITPATDDSVYQAALATFNRLRTLSVFYPSFDASTPLGNAFANLGNHLAVARGDATLGGTPISDATRTAVLDADGQIRPAFRSQIAGWAAMLNAAYPATTPLAWVGPTPPPPGTPLAWVGPTPPPPGMIQGGGPIKSGLTLTPGILDGELFGINKKLLLVGAVAAYFLFSEK